MSIFYTGRREFHFHLYQTWILVLEELEMVIIAFILNLAALIGMFQVCKAKLSVQPIYAEGVKLFMRILGDAVYDRWLPELAILCAKITAFVYVACIVIALLSQLFYITKFFYGLMGVLTRILLFVLPVLYAAAKLVSYELPMISLKDAYVVAFIPCLFLFFKCFKDARLFMPELGRVLAGWYSTLPRYSLTNTGRHDEGPGGPDSAGTDRTAIEKRYGRILGLKGNVEPDDIRRQYRELVKQYHPDRVQHLGPRLRETAERESKQINEAYEYFVRKYGL